MLPATKVSRHHPSWLTGVALKGTCPSVSPVTKAPYVPVIERGYAKLILRCMGDGLGATL